MVALNYAFLSCCWIVFAAAIGVGVFFLARYVAKRFGKARPSMALLTGIISGLAVFLFLGWVFVTFAFGPANPIGRPPNSAFVGQWAPPEESRQRTEQEDYGLFSRTLIFHEDGTFEMRPTPDLPIACKVGVNRPGCSGIGRWRVERSVDDHWEIRLIITQLDGMPVNRSHGMHVGNLFPPYQLYTYISDPDNGEMVYLKRVAR